ncbi:MAG: glycosyltransferase family 2 protein [Rhodospirillales bacterium]
MSEAAAPPDRRVTVACVTHNSAAVIGDMLASIPPDIPVIICDNLSDDGTPDIVARDRPSATLIRRDVNDGYGRGMNRALAVVDTPYAFLMGPDTTLADGAIERLAGTAERFPGAGLVGPEIRNPDGSVELSHDVELERRAALGRRDGEPAPAGPLCADFLSGAGWLVRMDALRAIGGFDPAIFLYYEDDDVCRRMRRTGYSLVLDPAAVITHIGGGSVPATGTYSWFKYWHMGWSRLYFARKHGGAAWGEYLRTAPRLLVKAAFYALTVQSGKARRDLARFSGMTAALRGKPSTATVPAGPRQAP